MKTSILVAESDPALAGVMVETFSSGEYNVKAVSSVEVAFVEIEKEMPDVMLVSDELSKGRGMELCQRVQEKQGQTDVPTIIFLTNDPKRHDLHGRTRRLDAWLRKPVDPILLKSTVESLLLRRKKQLPSNPLTKLPGPVALSNEIERRRALGEVFSTCTFQLSAPHAETYRAKYGELKFTAMIKLAAYTIASCALAHGGEEAFAAHRGTPEEPEFVVLIKTEHASEFGRAACEEFDTSVELLYDRTDRAEGCLIIADETGKRGVTPLVCLRVQTGTEEKVASVRTS